MSAMKGAVASLAFRSIPKGDNLFSTEMLLLKGGTVVERKAGEPTLVGHAIGQAQELLGHWALVEIETPAEKFFKEVRVL